MIYRMVWTRSHSFHSNVIESLMYNFCNGDLESIKACAGCNEKSGAHYHFTGRLVQKDREELIFGLLLCANIPGPIQNFPLFSHLSPDSYAKFEAQIKQPAQFYKSLHLTTNDVLDEELRKAAPHFSPVPSVRSVGSPTSRFTKLSAIVQKLKFSPNVAVTDLQNMRPENSIEAYYRMLILASCYLTGLGCATNKMLALEYLQNAVSIAERSNQKNNYLFVINMAAALKDFSSARILHYRILILRYQQILNESPQEYFESDDIRESLTGFIGSIKRDLVLTNDRAERENIEKYLLLAEELEINLIAEKTVKHLMEIDQVGYFPISSVPIRYGDTLAIEFTKISENKNKLTLNRREKLMGALQAAAIRTESNANCDLVTFFYEWRYSISGSENDASILAQRAVNGVYAAKDNGILNLEKAKFYYKCAAEAAAKDLDFNAIIKIIDICKELSIDIDLNDWIHRAMNAAIPALKARQKVDIEDLLLLIRRGNIVGDRAVEVLQAHVSSEGLFPAFLQLAIEEFKAGRKSFLIKLLRQIVTHYMVNSVIEVVSRSRSLLMITGLYNENQELFNSVDDVESRPVVIAFIETLERGLPEHIKFCVKSNHTPGLEEMSSQYRQNKSLSLPSSIPNFSQAVNYWLGRITVYQKINEEYLREGLTDTVAGEILDFCYRSLSQERPKIIYNKKSALAEFEHSDAYLATLKDDIAVLDKMINKSSADKKGVGSKLLSEHEKLKKQLIRLGENLVKLVASKVPVDDLGIYKHLGEKFITAIEVGRKLITEIEALNEKLQNYLVAAFAAGDSALPWGINYDLKYAMEKDYVQILPFYLRLATGVVLPAKFHREKMIPVAPYSVDKDLKLTMEESGLNLIENLKLMIPPAVAHKFLITARDTNRHTAVHASVELRRREVAITNRIQRVLDGNYIYRLQQETVMPVAAASNAQVTSAKLPAVAQKSFGFDDLLPKPAASAPKGTATNALAVEVVAENKEPSIEDKLKSENEHLKIDLANYKERAVALNNENKTLKELNMKFKTEIDRLHRKYLIELEKAEAEIKKLREADIAKDCVLLSHKAKATTLAIEKSELEGQIEVKDFDVSRAKERLDSQDRILTAVTAERNKLLDQNHILAVELTKARAEIEKLKESQAQILLDKLDTIQVPTESIKVAVPKLG